MSLKPLPQAAITAAKLRAQAKELMLLADELEASVPAPTNTKTKRGFRNPLTGKWETPKCKR